MSFEGLTGRPDRVIAWAGRLQRKHGVLEFPYAVVKKHGDDGGGAPPGRFRPTVCPGPGDAGDADAWDVGGRDAHGGGHRAARRARGPAGAAVLGSALAVFAVLLLGARLLLVRPAPFRALWPGPVLGAALVTVVLNGGASLLAREQERIPAACAEFHLTTQNSPPVPGGPPPAADEPG